MCDQSFTPAASTRQQTTSQRLLTLKTCAEHHRTFKLLTYCFLQTCELEAEWKAARIVSCEAQQAGSRSVGRWGGGPVSRRVTLLTGMTKTQIENNVAEAWATAARIKSWASGGEAEWVRNTRKVTDVERNWNQRTEMETRRGKFPKIHGAQISLVL